MKTLIRLLMPSLVLMLMLGCSSSKTLRDPSQIPDSANTDRMEAGAELADGVERSGTEAAYTDASESDLASGSDTEEMLALANGSPAVLDDLLEDVAVPVDSLMSPAAGLDLPDISDSLAAETEAHIPSSDEIFDYPVEVNRRVLTWIDQYTGRSKRSFENSLQRSGKYLPMAREIFAEEGVPQDLAFLGHIESGFRYNARSRASALGLWQFMRGTAREHGLRCDSHVEERLDPVKSTRAAAQYLSTLHARYDDWYLALAAYNAGPGKVDRAIKKAGSTNFWEIARTRYLVNETRNFVPAILAATILAKSPGAYGLTEETDDPLQIEPLVVDSPTDLRVIAKCANRPLEEIREYNPALLYSQTPSGRYVVNVPRGSADLAAARLAEIPEEARLVFFQHKVRNGDTLGGIARKYGTTVAAIQEANGMGRKTLIRAGKTLKIPSRGAAAMGLADSSIRQSGSTHTIKRGESLSKIAKAYGTSVRQIQAANRIDDPSRIWPGQTLEIPGSAKALQVAAVETESPPDASAASTSSDDAADESSGEGIDSDTDSRLLADASLALESDAASDPDAESMDWADPMGRVESTAHLVEQAREEIRQEEEHAKANGIPIPEGLYTVRRGDTLSGIAKRHDVSVSQIRSWNGLGSGSLIKPGQELHVSTHAMPAAKAPTGKDARLHIVAKGETLWRIAKQYGVDLAELLSWNGLSKRSTIHPGQKLKVF